MKYLFDPLYNISEYTDLVNSIKSTMGSVSIVGPSDTQKVHICCAISTHMESKGIFITYNEMQARKAYEDFSFFLGDEVLFFPSREIIMHDIEAKSYEDVFERINAIDRLVNGEYKLLVTSVEAISHKLISRELFIDNRLEFKTGMRVNLSELVQKLITMGYERMDTVEVKGQFAIRGGIVDIFAVNNEQAMRIEFFDDEIDSIRSFDPITQRSVDKIISINIVPAREVIYPQNNAEEIIGRIKKELLSQSNYSENSPLANKIMSDIERIANDHYFPGIDRYIPYIIDKPDFIIDYLDNNIIIFFDELSRQRQRSENLLLEHNETCKSLLEKGKILPGSQDIYFTFEDIFRKIESNITVHLNSLLAPVELRSAKNYSIASRSIGSYHSHMELLMDEIRSWKENGNKIVLLSGTRGKGERLVETLRSNNIEAGYNEDPLQTLESGQVRVVRGSLNKGFEYPSIGLVVLSDKEVFGQDRKRKKLRTSRKGDRISLFTDLSVGDFVVHQTHGIGQYVGIEKLAVENIKRDYLKIRYQDGGFLYIPTNQLDLIQKYIGSEGKMPKLSKLGGSDWIKTKKKVKESLRELAGELIKLYAQRQALKGFVFSKDTVWQRQFEEQFPYEETEDQLKCVEEIKQDMESGKTMDRLLCGDVGYGKTEVAIRAIFKAVMDGKQVAYLVPTTILAQQHYSNFKERMKDFPVTVDVISRFRSASEQKEIIKNVKNGNIDVLVGTHRLLQKDIHFKDLGMLVVDEEQRFGVAHKEKMKNLRPNIDVLTLTATPIPRTLHMSLVGIRDISVIEDPPEERYPVQTYVMEYDEDVIRDAVIRELGRRGQVFYLYNRVKSIDVKAAQIQNLVPDARVAVAHGQMSEGQLEDIMQAFINNEYDILVCTTIIESGLDMPNVNTIIVEDADRMGLAQLYQLRGRVGRSNRLAYAYITYKKDKVVSEVAEKRLQAIKEFTELGAGFKIAMRDMEIRGAGNLLGPEQHGHMESVGYDMYCRLLDEAIREQKGSTVVEEEIEIAIDININAYIDEEYIASENQKIEMYKKIASIQDEQDMLDIEDELLDRYGDPPRAVSNLIDIAYIKSLAAKIGFTSIAEKNGSIVFHLGSTKQPDIKVIFAIAERYKRQLLFNAGSNPHLVYRITGIERSKLLNNIKILLQDIKSFEVS